MSSSLSNTKNDLMNNSNPEIIDFKHEIANEFHNNSYDSLKIWKMFQSKKSNLPNNQRIQNLSWRVNSISAAKKHHMVLKNQSKIQQKNLSLLKPSNHPTNEEFDYIEHIKKMTKEEFGDYNNNPLPQEFHSSNPISIYSNSDANLDYSPDAANSLTSNTNSIFSNTRYDHSLSISSQVSMNKQQQSQQQQQSGRAQPLHQNIQHQSQVHSNDFNIEHFLDLDTTIKNDPDNKGDSNFNEFDLLDFTKLDSHHLNQQEHQHHHDVDDDHKMSNPDAEKKIDNFSLSNYINSLETALKEDNKPTTITPIFNNQTMINDTFTIPNNTNYNVTMNPKLQQITKEQMSCNSCGTTTTPLWRKSTNERNENLILCNACGLFLKLHGNLSKRNGNGNIINNNNNNNNINNNNNKRLFSNNHNTYNSNDDDQMGELFIPDKKKMNENVVKEEDYDWLKFGL